MRTNTNLYKIPHLSTMTYEDIKTFEENGITPRNPNKMKGGENGQPIEPAAGEGEDLLG